MLINECEKISRLPPTHEYMRELLENAVWLILSGVEEKQDWGRRAVLPREINLKIKLLSSQERLPVSVEETIKFGTAYDPHTLLLYTSGTYDMGTPGMYYDDPTEYWETAAKTDCLLNH